jgi:hypothetical protein
VNVDFEHPDQASQTARHIEGFVQAAEIQGQDDFLAGGGIYGSGGSWSSSMRTRVTPLSIKPSRAATR